MLLDICDTPADIGPDEPARAGRMMRFACAARTRWRAMFLSTGAVLTLLGVVLADDTAGSVPVRPMPEPGASNLAGGR